MRKILVATACSVLFSGPSIAGDFVPAAPLGSTAMDFDTRDGAYSYWRASTVDGINAIRTTFQIHRLGETSQWSPAFTIALVSGENRINFQITSQTRRLPLTMHAMTLIDKKPKADHNFTANIGLDQKVDLSFDWTADGEISIKAGTETYSVALGSPVTSVEFYGSTGEIEFDPLQFGRFTP